MKIHAIEEIYFYHYRLINYLSSMKKRIQIKQHSKDLSAPYANATHIINALNAKRLIARNVPSKSTYP